MRERVEPSKEAASWATRDTANASALLRGATAADLREDHPTTDDARAGTYANLGPKWTRDVAFRTPFARRQALVELDVLAAQALGLSFEELRLLYEVQFPVLQQYERETFYDQRGRIVFTVNKGLPGVGLERKQWEEIRDARAGDVLPEWARDGVGGYVPPFDVRDRVEEWFQLRVAESRGRSTPNAKTQP
ncbi:MAG: hypothetical protein H6721_01125 [Sandaracinus sp.]|nr:hypothetical protein [Sandaracinus sp.]